jgi:hypothetical protein
MNKSIKVLAGIVFLAALVGVALSKNISAVLFVLGIGVGGFDVYKVATKQGSKWGVVVGSLIHAAGIGYSIYAKQWVFLALIVLVGGVHLFARRTLFRYLRPAAEMPGEFHGIIEQSVMLSEESIAGIAIGARKTDGAVIGVGWAEVRGGAILEQAGVKKFAQDAEAARGVLKKTNDIDSNFICLVAGTKIYEKLNDVMVVSSDMFKKAVDSVKGPDLATIAAAAEKAGITLSREQLRMVEKRQQAQSGKKTNGKKIVHKGRVTKVEK